MFAYCRNNPICRIDVSGNIDASSIDDENDKDLFPDEDIGYSSSGSGSDGTKSGSTGSATGGNLSIYRFGYTGPDKLVPTKNDVNSDKPALSFSTKAKPGSAMTTIEQVNNTGVLRAELDNARHVSIYPIGGSVLDWYNAGVNSIWTQALLKIVSLFIK